MHDVVVVGAGPAGLSAARVTAQLGLRTLVLDRLRAAGELDHPCSGAIAPVPPFVSGRRDDSSLRFLEIDLCIPNDLIAGTPTLQRYVGPAGREIRASFPVRDDFPIAVVDKPGLLRLLAEQARLAGAELRFGVPVEGLLREGERIAGVRTRAEEIRGRIVISAEGASRRLCEEAGLYDGAPPAAGYVFVVRQELEAPAAGAAGVGQIATLGRRYTSAPPALGTVVIAAPGRAGVYFSVFAGSPKLDTAESLWHYLEEYKQRDPRVSGLLAGSTVIRRSACRLALRDRPARAVADGFVGAGDAITPGGHLGIVPSLYLGQEAGWAAARAIQGESTLLEALEPYDRLCRGPLLRGLDTEGRIVTSLAAMTDGEIDRLCQTLGKMNLAPFFFGERWPIVRETARWVARGLPWIVRDWKLLRRIMAGAGIGR